ncbi:MAG: arylesterase [bacterium]|nr:arylesterase [bacterium]
MKRSILSIFLLLGLLWAPVTVWAEQKLLFLGDSLTAGLGVDPAQAYPSLVEQELRNQGFKVQVINAGVSGSTSASGPARLKWYLQAKPDLLFLALGANDGLRGLDINEMKANLSAVVEAAQKAGVPVVIAGLRMPPNYGKEYTQAFHQAFFEVAERYQLPHLPKLLAGVAGRPPLNQADGIHPNAEGHRIIAAQVAQFIAPLLKKK